MTIRRNFCMQRAWPKTNMKYLRSLRCPMHCIKKKKDCIKTSHGLWNTAENSKHGCLLKVRTLPYKTIVIYQHPETPQTTLGLSSPEMDSMQNGKVACSVHISIVLKLHELLAILLSVKAP